MSSIERRGPSPLKPPSPVEAEANAAYQALGETFGKMGSNRILDVAERLKKAGDRRNLNALTQGYSKVPYSTSNPDVKNSAVTPLQPTPEGKKAGGV